MSSSQTKRGEKRKCTHGRDAGGDAGRRRSDDRYHMSRQVSQARKLARAGFNGLLAHVLNLQAFRATFSYRIRNLHILRNRRVLAGNRCC